VVPAVPAAKGPSSSIDTTSGFQRDHVETSDQMLQTFSGGAVVFRDRAKLLKGLLRGGMACLAPTVGNPQVTTKAVATCVPTLDSSPGGRPRARPQEALMQLKRVNIHGHEIGYYAAGRWPCLRLFTAT